MRQHLLFAAALLIACTGILAFISGRIPRHYTAVPAPTSFEQYLAQFPKRELPFSFDPKQFAGYLELHSKFETDTRNMPYESLLAIQDSIESIEDKLLYFPENPRILNVGARRGSEKDSLTGDSFDRFSSVFSREYAGLFPIMAFETNDYHATIVFVGHAISPQPYAIKRYGSYELNYFDKTGKCLGVATIASLMEQPLVVLAGSIDKDLRFTRGQYKINCGTGSDTGIKHLVGVEEVEKTARLRYLLDGESEFVKSMEILTAPLAVSDERHK